MQERYDVVIIGAGVAGLVAGNYLVDAGGRVLIVEQNAYPGGCACSFTRAGFTFDAAVHWISQAGEGGIVRRILSDFGLADAVKFVRLPGPPAVWCGGRRIQPDYGKEALIREFSRAFPDETGRLRNFWDDADGTKEQLWRLVKAGPGRMSALDKLLFNITFPLRFGKIARYHRKKASDVIDRAVRDKELARALAVLGIFPGISFVHYAWFNSVALDADAYYPLGGVQAVPDALAARFIERGGTVRYKTRVEKIVVEGGRASGVALAGGEPVAADAVISAGDAKNTFLNMVGEEKLPAEFVSEIRTWKTSESFFYVYLGLDMAPGELRAKGLDGRPVWFFPKMVDKKTFPMLGGDALGIGVPSLMDPSLAPEGKSAAILGITASCTFMKGCPVRKEGEDGKGQYRAVKEMIGEYLIDLAEEAIPGLKEKVEVKVFATPHTFERYTMNHLGASSGWSMAAEAQHKLPVQTPVPGLYMAGHWTMNPGGVPAAFVSGMLAAQALR